MCGILYCPPWYFISPHIDLVPCIMSVHPFRCIETQRGILDRMFTLEEIKAEFFALPSDKAPSPDGFTGEFFKH